MLRLNPYNRKKTSQKAFYTMRKPGFVIPPENQLFECRPPEEEKVALGVFIKAKGGYVKRRGGPSTLGYDNGDLSKEPVSVKRNVFQPTRQQFNKPAPRTARVSDEELLRVKQEDVARNGALVQVSNKTLNRVFDKFDLFTISNKILKMKREGTMSKQEVRASALLKLTKEIRNAMREARVDEAKEAIDKIEEKHPGTIPSIDDLGTTPEEVAENPLLPLAMMLDAGEIEESSYLALLRKLEDGTLYINPDTLKVNDLIPVANILQFDIDTLEDGIQDMPEGDLRDILEVLVRGDFPIEMDEEPIEEEKIEYEEGKPIIPRLAPKPPRELGFLPQPIAPPPIDLSKFDPVKPTEEEVKDDKVYEVVETGKDIGTALRKYITQQNEKILKILSSIPPTLSIPDKQEVSKNVQKAIKIGNALTDLSTKPDNVLEDEMVQKEIERLLQQVSDITGNLFDFSKMLDEPSTTPLESPIIEVMEDSDELEPIRQRTTPQLSAKRYDIGTPLSEEEAKNVKREIGSRDEVWNKTALTTRRGATGLRRENLVFDRTSNKVKSKNAVMGAKSRRKPTRRKK